MNLLSLSNVRLCRSDFVRTKDFSQRWSETDRAWIIKCRVSAERERRLAVRLLLLHCLDWLTPGHGFILCKAPNGKPFLSGSNPPAISMSHAGDLVAIAISDEAPIGVDIEKHANVTESDIWSHLTHFERARANQEHDPADRLRVLSRIWTGKEACSKWLGKGLHQPLDTMEVDLDRSTVVVTEPASPPLHCYSRNGWTYSLSLTSAIPSFRCVYLSPDNADVRFNNLDESGLVACLA
jgi:4'-phosphopantetheinyl transferase